MAKGVQRTEPLPLAVNTQDVVVTVEDVVASSIFGQLEEDSLEHKSSWEKGSK